MIRVISTHIIYVKDCVSYREKARRRCVSREYIFQSKVNRGNNQKLHQSPTLVLCNPLYTVLWFSSLLTNCSSRCTLILKTISYYISVKVFPSLLPTHLSVLSYFILEIFWFGPPSFRVVNLSLCCSCPQLLLSFIPRFVPFLSDLLNDIFLPGSKPSFSKPCEMPQVLKLYPFFWALGDLSGVRGPLFVCVSKTVSGVVSKTSGD